GGCCGTTPEFISQMVNKLKGIAPVTTSPKRVTAVCSDSSTVILNSGIHLIGERINPTGKPKLKEALKKEDYNYILNEAVNQRDNGADILDVNVGLPEIDEEKILKKTVITLQSGISLPLQIDSTDIKAVEGAVRVYKGKPLINSVNGDEESMSAVFPVAKKYGACVLGLCLDKNGIPETAEGRFEIAERILKTALSYGIPKEDILIDCLVLTASAQQEQVLTTLEAIKLVKSRLNLKCVLGVSNVSFGLPSRPLLNSVFLAAAFGAGLDAPIVNPCSREIMDTVNAFKVLNAQDKNGSEFIEKYGNLPPSQSEPINIAPKQKTDDSGENIDLKGIIIKGFKDMAAPVVEEMLKTTAPMEIINEYFIPALDEVGRLYETGKIFLPQLMLSAETVQNGFEVISKKSAGADVKREKIVIATVEGDIHDIGKNIVKMLLSNYGYEVIDLGKDVPVDDVVAAVKKHSPSLVGLSALMTTTVKNMQRTIDALKEDGLNCKTMVGGAVLNDDYARMVGADYYAKDANESVKVAEKIFEDK
ncbi:MAG: dihydropteroate synthase, partial [Clostridia bacterium]|nr:dihydropteroate synthase [Clostridia bacterium]